MNAAKTVLANNPSVTVSFTLPVLPEGLTQDGKNMLTQAKNGGIDFLVNIMAMDYGVSEKLCG